MSLPPKQRAKVYDLIIIGGGINGAGIARDAAERGLSVFLAEKNDFAYGATFRSTKLIHGGLRYLEHYEIGLVRESLRERETLLKQAPHLVRPIKFVIPIYDDNKYGYGKVKLGLLAYDLLSYDKSLENHNSYSKEELMNLEPHLRNENCRGGFDYFDCQVAYPERLCLENLLLARDAGADINNYTEVIGLIRSDGGMAGVIAKEAASGGSFEVRGSIVINASGPWVDEVLNLSARRLGRQLGGTKGSHVLVPRFKNGPRHAMYVPAHQDGRPFFIIPWREYYWVGTTDIRYHGDLDKVAASRDEIDYLLREIHFLFPESNVQAEDIFYCLAGIRPLPRTTDAEEAEITRRHLIVDHEDEGVEGLISIIGGKLTTYRDLAEEAVDYAVKKLGRSVRPCMTKSRPLWGGGMSDIDAFLSENCHQYALKYDLSNNQIVYLISIYGTKFLEILKLVQDNPGLGERICPNNPAIKAQIVFSLKNEFSKTLADIYLRRTGIGTSSCRGLDCAKTGARVMAKHQGWRWLRLRQEVRDYRAQIENLYGCHL